MQTLTMRARLFGSLGAITLFVVMLSAAAVGTIMGLRTLAVEEVGANTRRVELTGAVRASFLGMQRAQRGMILFTHEHDRKNMEDNASLFESDQTELGEDLQALRALASEGQAKAAVSAIEKRAAQWRSQFPELRRFCEKGEPSEATRIAVTAISPLMAEMERAVSDLQRNEKESLETAAGHVQSSAGTGVWTGLLSAGLALGAALLGLWTVKSVTTSLGGLTDKMASGANQVAAAARQIASSSQALARGTSDQAASLEETSASSTEVTSMTAQNAGNSRSAAALMGEVDARVASANRTLSEMVASMNEISTSSEKISRIIKVIDEIAFQTNILALNAAVEAARAGEAGMGFAVVADEVRNLAQRSAQAAKDTAALIEESIARSGQGSAKLDEVKRAIKGITEGTTRAKTLIDEVQVGSHEQARGVEQIGRAITQMEQVTQQNAASAEQSASASQELSAQADAMKSTVDEMRHLLGAESAAPAKPAKPGVQAVLRPQAARPVNAVATASRALLPVARRTKKVTDLPTVTHRDALHEFPLDKDFVEF